MKYLEFDIRTNESGVEPVLAALYSIGIENAEVRDPRDAKEIMSDKEKYEWDYIDEKVAEGLDDVPEIVLYLGEEDSGLEQSVQELLEDIRKKVEEGFYGEGADLGELSLSRQVRDDSDWKDKWKEFFKPSRISERIVIKPSWEEYIEEPGDLVIEIDPGMAFGTGTHETTSMVIGLIEKYMKEGDSLLDLGCGSGILSIAAAKLGASKVMGIDIDEDAVRVTKENVAANGVDSVVDARTGDVTKESFGEYDMVAANLMAELIVMISEGVKSSIKNGGIFISSGILEEKEDMVSAALRDVGFTILETCRKGEWVAIAAERS